MFHLEFKHFSTFSHKYRVCQKRYIFKKTKNPTTTTHGLCKQLLLVSRTEFLSFCITQYCNDLFKQKELEPKSVDTSSSYPEDPDDPAHSTLKYLFVFNDSRKIITTQLVTYTVLQEHSAKINECRRAAFPNYSHMMNEIRKENIFSAPGYFLRLSVVLFCFFFL